MQVVSLAIPEVLVIKPTRHNDERGYFVETYNERSFAAIGIDSAFIQDNQSLSIHRGTIRGLHFQAPPHAQAKLVRVLQGSVFDVAVDLRRDSLNYGRWCGATLSAEEGHLIFIPVGFAHAYCVLEPNTVVAYKVDALYDRGSEGGLRWNDPDLAISWPVDPANIRVSGKDATLPVLREFSSPFVFEP